MMFAQSVIVKIMKKIDKDIFCGSGIGLFIGVLIGLTITCIISL